MSRHRSARIERRRRAESRHRAEVRPRYGRIATLLASLAVTVVAVLGGAGALPSSADDAPSEAAASLADSADQPETVDTSADDTSATTSDAGDELVAVDEPHSTARPGETSRSDSKRSVPDPAPQPVHPADGAPTDVALPGESGEGRRVVFSEGRQRVWLVGDDGTVERTYLVSGSVYDNLDPGTYEVYSRSEEAVGIDDSGTMELFVRFTQGPSGAAIGFHTIPVDDGEPVQSVQQLGTPLSHGCIRQKHSDAVALWDFAPLGTTVVVTA